MVELGAGGCDCAFASHIEEIKITMEAIPIQSESSKLPRIVVVFIAVVMRNAIILRTRNADP